MTAPTSIYPENSLGAMDAGGAFEIGGGDFKFGQDYVESVIKNMFKLPAPTMGNALDLLRDSLMKLPLDALLSFKELLPDPVEEAWDTVAGAVDAIMDALNGIPAFLQRLRAWFKIDMLEDVFTEHIGDLMGINWLDPSALWSAITSAWDFWKGIGNWAWAVLENITGLLIGNQTGFIKDLVALFDLDVAQVAWNTFLGAWGGINWLNLDALWQALQAVGKFVRDLFHWLIGVIKNFTTVVDLEGLASSLGLTALAAALNSWATTLTGINWSNPGAALMTAIGAFVTLAQDAGNWILDVIASLLNWDTSVVHSMFSSVGDFVERIIEFFWGATGLSGWLNTLESLAGEAGASIAQAIRAVYNGVRKFVDMFGDFTGIADFITFLADLFGPDGLLGWVAKIKERIDKPFATDTNQGNILEQALEMIFGGIPVSQINSSTQNLLSQGNFNNDITITSGDGWSWDGSLTATGTGGSAKCTSTGAVQRLYSRQVVKVANGDRVDLSCKVRSASFTAASGRYMELAIVPWKLVANVMTAQTPVVISTRTAASNGAWSTLSGATYVVANDIVRLTARLTVVGNSGSLVWFDEVFAGKSGGLQQGNVENLLSTWESAWNMVFGSGGAGKTWLDFSGVGGALQTIFNTAGLGVTNAGNAAATGTSIIDAIGKAVFGEGSYSSFPYQVKSALQYFINKLFGVNTVQDDLQPSVIPPLSGSVIQDGEISIGVLPTDDIGAEVNPSSASGAQMSRRTTVNSNASNGNTKTADGFYGHIDINGVDVEIINTAGQVVTGTGAKSNLRPVFRAKTAGWYLVEICYRINPSFSGGGRIAPVLYRSTNYTGPDSMSLYKVGTDVDIPTPIGGGKRFVQNTFNVFLPVGGAVQSGHNGDLTASGVFDADTDGSTTYFSISLLNKTYA